MVQKSVESVQCIWHDCITLRILCSFFETRAVGSTVEAKCGLYNYGRDGRSRSVEEPTSDIHLMWPSRLTFWSWTFVVHQLRRDHVANFWEISHPRLSHSDVKSDILGALLNLRFYGRWILITALALHTHNTPANCSEIEQLLRCKHVDFLGRPPYCNWPEVNFHNFGPPGS